MSESNPSSSEMLERAHEMACLAGLVFKHAGRSDIAARLREAVRGWDDDKAKQAQPRRDLAIT